MLKPGLFSKPTKDLSGSLIYDCPINSDTTVIGALEDIWLFIEQDEEGEIDVYELEIDNLTKKKLHVIDKYKGWNHHPDMKWTYLHNKIVHDMKMEVREDKKINYHITIYGEF